MVQSSSTSLNRELSTMLSSALVRSVLDSLPDAMVIIDSTGRIVFANHQVFELFGYANDDIVGAPVELLVPERFRDRHVGHRQTYTANVRARPMGSGMDLFAVRKDGSEFPVEISLSPISQEGSVLVAAAIRDVTERKRVEQALEAVRRDAEHANRAKSRFLATASHDLRQPLQALALLNGALRRMISDDDCREALEQQDQAVTRCRDCSMPCSISASSNRAPSNSSARDFEVAPLFDAMRREFAGIAASKGLRFSIDSPRDFAHSDPALIGQVLRNLLSNAIKYTPHRLGRVAL